MLQYIRELFPRVVLFSLVFLFVSLVIGAVDV